ncbi:MAG: RagB/SusD family nutrient uptake outer membrane protein [Rhodothermales bacterium]
MRTNNYILSTLLGCFLLIAGCDSLNLDPPDELTSSAVWEDPALTKAYLNQIYSATGYGFGNPMLSGAAVDEAKYTHNNQTDANLQSTLSPDNRGVWNSNNNTYESHNWAGVYASLRDLNTFIVNVGASEALPADEKATLLGEARFLRGYFYQNLWKLYGGVPITETPFELGGDLSQYQIPRNSFEETYNFIIADLDAAATALSTDARRPGAAHKGAALALKSRVMLIAASDLYNDNPSGMAETGFMSGDQMSRWQAAKDAAQAVMDLSAYDLAAAPTADEYHDLVVAGSGSGQIWARFFNGDGADAHNHSLWNSPNGYNSWSGDTPLQNHVDAYEMADGSEFSWDDPVHAAAPYANRDPRFHANILYNGRVWRPRSGGAAEADPRGVIQTGWYEQTSGGSLSPGLDTREGPIQNWNGTKSGYNLAKFLDSGIVPNEQQAFNPWVHLRYAEVLLAYAEASAELGQDGDALMALNAVRQRVGMPDVPAGGDGTRSILDHIRQERQVELAFEGHRYFDVRRWMTAPDVYACCNDGMRVEGFLDPAGELLVTNTYRYEYNVIKVQDTSWDDRNYFLPIPRDEINRNPSLTQNPGYN